MKNIKHAYTHAFNKEIGYVRYNLIFFSNNMMEKNFQLFFYFLTIHIRFESLCEGTQKSVHQKNYTVSINSPNNNFKFFSTVQKNFFAQCNFYLKFRIRTTFLNLRLPLQSFSFFAHSQKKRNRFEM